MDRWVEANCSPALGVRSMSSVRSSRVFEYPVRATEKLTRVTLPTVADWSDGAACGMERDSESGEAGVMSNPPGRLNDGVSTIVPAVVPVCSGIAGLPLNKACVALAGIVKLA